MFAASGVVDVRRPYDKATDDGGDEDRRVLHLLVLLVRLA